MLIRTLPWQRLLRLRHALWLFYVWSGVIILLITAAAAADGGIDSPLLLVYALPMLFAAVAYPPRAVLLIGVCMVVAVAALAVSTGVTDPARAWMTISVLALSTWTFGYAATNYRRSAAATRRLAERLAEQVNVDGLTDCLNHRAFQERLAVEVARSQRTGTPLGLLLCDVDHFTTVNDRHGHQVGDRLLANVAAELRTHVRLQDDVARIGGEEFAVLLPGAGIERGTEVAQRLRSRVGSLEEPVPVTISIGVAVLPDMAHTGAELLRQAAAGLAAAATRSPSHRAARPGVLRCPTAAAARSGRGWGTCSSPTRCTRSSSRSWTWRPARWSPTRRSPGSGAPGCAPTSGSSSPRSPASGPSWRGRCSTPPWTRGSDWTSTSDCS
jgi:diguanylate cyclase (GGDEF)-like protein